MTTDERTSLHYTLTVADIPVEVRHKEIRNLHVGVYPPDGRVRVSAPMRLDADAIRVALVGRIPWIRRRRAGFIAQERQTAREYVSGESHYFLGRRYRLEVVEQPSRRADPPARPPVSIHGDTLRLTVHPGAGRTTGERVMNSWYRTQLAALIPGLRKRWEPLLGVVAQEVRIRKMKTKWGSFNTDAGRIWLNLALITKSSRSIEYVFVHELVHLLERHHSDHFRAIMEHHLPDWRLRRDELNRAPLAHEAWD